jgi:hypothetical protein
VRRVGRVARAFGGLRVSERTRGNQH